MLDIPVALASFAATIAFARYVETGRSRWNILFAVLAAISILTKGNGVAMALVPPLAILFCRRFDLLRHFSFWVPVPVVAISTCKPLDNILTYGQVAPGFRYHWGAEYARIALAANSEILLTSAGPVLSSRCPGRPACGHIGQSRPGCSSFVQRRIVGCNMDLPVSFPQRSRIGSIPLFPPLIVLAVYGASRATTWIWQRLAQATRPAIGHLATIAVGLVFATVWPLAINTEPSPRASLNCPPRLSGRCALRTIRSAIAVPADREGSAVARLALHDPNRPSMFAIRGSRLLGGGGYNNQDYLPLYDNEAEVSKAIDRYAIPFVLLIKTFPGRGEACNDRSKPCRLTPPTVGDLYVHGSTAI